jgi:hypothetical protein
LCQLCPSWARHTGSSARKSLIRCFITEGTTRASCILVDFLRFIVLLWCMAIVAWCISFLLGFGTITTQPCSVYPDRTICSWEVAKLRRNTTVKFSVALQILARRNVSSQVEAFNW